ncbi:DUF748 domain-containing protein [Rhodoferax sp. U2-2l]|uniref:DUF748 domain-containing protein n=1 Tax=Rhodoferax sp. U2-2l TaxID=2884000 RepID=UPI001D0ACA28|nr:DUF748 domain-containing protein [Rhodoferax sp. U2-2l]MCB8745443.1 DUF748 domain-containing protein [Rhodoferax sp. U2-2l]
MKTDQRSPAVSSPSPLDQPWLRRSLWVLGGLLLLWAVTWLAVPPLLKSQAESRLGDLLGRQVTVGEVDFKPWSLELSVRDVAIARANGAGITSPQVTLGHLYIDMALQSLLRLVPVVDALVVASPHVHLTHLGQGRYDVDDMLARLTPPPQDPAEPASSPLRFALYNLMLSDGLVALTDAPRNQVHTLSQLQLNLPFLSNLDSKRDVLVSPKLAFDLNGTRFDSSAQALPFAQTRDTDVQLSFKDLDLAPYLAYLPASLPARLGAAVLDADLKLAFEQTDTPVVSLSGVVGASRVQISVAQGAAKDPASTELLAFDRLSVQLKDVQPLSRRVQLGQVTLTQPRLNVQRDHAGVLNLLALAQPAASSAAQNTATSSDAQKAGSDNEPHPADAASAPAWQVSVDTLALEGGEVAWLDQVPAQPAQLKLTALNMHATALAWPFSQPMPFDGSALLAGAALQFKGSATDQATDVSAQLAAWPLSAAQPYLADVLVPRLDGAVTADLGLRWAAAQGAQTSVTELKVNNLSLDKLVLIGGKKAPLASVFQVQLQEAVVDVGRQSASLGVIKVTQPKLAITRAANGRWMAQDWLQAPSAKQAAPAAAGQARAKRATAADPAPWQVKLGELQLSEGNVAFVDQSTPTPVRLAVTAAHLQLKNYANTGPQSFGFNLSARLRHGNTEPGKLAWRGSGALHPLALKGDLNAERLPIHALAPYLSDTLNIALLRADTSFKGRVSMTQQTAGLALQLKGDARLEDLQTRTLAQAEPFVAAEELLNWKSLSLSGINLALAPGAATQLEVQGTILSDFYARLILSEAGRLNLQDVLKPAVAPASQASGAMTGESMPAPPAVAAASAPGVPAAAPAPVNTALAPVVRFGPVSLLGGRVNFTDRFIKPNYSADLTELVGKLSAFSSQTTAGEIQLADLELRGRAEGSATLEVLGKINPLVQPIALDIQGKVRDLELAPLSTYSARYAGYGIERGKLSVDVAYKVQPDGQLTANNKLVLNQLRFGDKDPNATTSLPVKLAVALLADRNGVIDIDLPISGSLNDPQFRLLPIVFKVIGNLIVKAITSPFSLLASALGGGGDTLSMVSFEAGSAVLSDQAKAGLDKVAKALTDRPALKMTVVGTASLEVEREDFKRQQLQALVQAEKRRNQPAADGKEATAPVKASADEYPALLKAVYKRGDFPKPRNLIGLTKDMPVPEMEALLLAHLDASEAAMQALAVKRGVVVRDYLASLKLPSDRLFLGAAKAVAPESKWQPRAELNLTTE